MDGKFPVEPYKKKKPLPSTTHSLLNGKKGKVIEVDYTNQDPAVVTLTIKSNRGTVKDIIILSADDLIDLGKSIAGSKVLYLKDYE